jgi:predicted DNA-binding protein with PD1-like motif
LKKSVLGFYKEGKYIPINKPGPLEIASCMGNISIKEEKELVVHGHIVVSDINGGSFGGHVMSGCLVDATAELVLVETESGVLQREFDTQRNLYLLSLKNRA